MSKHFVERERVLGRQLLGLIHGGVSDLPGRHVDDAAQAQVIGGIVDHAQIGQHILDLGAIKELHAAHHLVGHAVAFEGVFQRVGLGVHPIKHGVLPPVHTAIVGHHDLSHHEIGLVALVECGLDGHLVASAILCPQGLAFAAHVVADHGIGGIQNVLGGPVVLFQADGSGAAIFLLKAQNVLNIGAAKTINALVVVAHHADVAMSAGQQARQQILQMVGVLILVNEHVAELVLVVFPGRSIGLQQADRVQDDVVEVQSIGAAQSLVVKCIYFTDSDFTPFSVALPFLRKHRRSLHLVLGGGNHRQDLPDGKGLLVQTQFLQNILDHPLAVVGIVDGEVAGKAQLIDITPQDPHAGGVERSGPHVPGLLPQHLLQTLLQLVGGLVGEGNGQYLPGSCRLHSTQILSQRALLRRGGGGILLQKLHLVLGNRQRDLVGIAATSIAQQIGYPVDQHRGLAAAGSGQQQQRSLRRQHTLELHIIQMAVIRRNGTAACRNKTSLQFVHRVPLCLMVFPYFNTVSPPGQQLPKTK